MGKYFQHPHTFPQWEQMKTYAALLQSEWPAAWTTWDTVASVYRPLVHSVYETSTPMIDDNTQNDRTPRWITVTQRNTPQQPVDSHTLELFPKSTHYALNHMHSYIRVGFVFTDGVIPPHVDTEYVDDDLQMWNITQAIQGTLEFTVGEDTRNMDPGILRLWNGNELHHAPHTGFWVSAIAQVWI